MKAETTLTSSSSSLGSRTTQESTQFVHGLVGPGVAARTRGQRFIQFPLTRIVLAIFLTALAGGLSLTYLGKLAHTWGGGVWPELLAASIVLVAYWMYVRIFERRQVTELSTSRVLPEFGVGLLTGAALVACVAALVAALGCYRIVGMNGWAASILAPLGMMTFVGVLEEIISRGIVFRITETSLGSWVAIAISSLLFGLAHLPGEGAGALAIAITIVAGVMFAAAYMLTRRLWLAIGIHIAWNYTLGSIFSVAVSGREANGLFVGRLSGPELFTGGTYGFEASVVTLIVLGLFAASLLRAARTKGRLVAPAWRR